MKLLKDNILALQNERGATLVEFSVTAGLLFFILFVGIELIRLGFTALTLQFIVSDGARYGSVGTHLPSFGNLNTAATRAAELKKYIVDYGPKFGLDLNNDQVRVCKVLLNKTQCNVGELDSAGPREIFQVEVYHNFPLIIPGFKFTLTTKAVGKNERFRTGV